jgi:NAD(P)-dependent dehydrogenase (short-subunit alcohol dehydrogenase family)
VEFGNSTVAVTGASGGIGRELCAHLTTLGLRVFGLDRVVDPDPPAGVAAVAVDVTSAESMRHAVAEVYAMAAGPVDLVSCAGIVEGDVPAEDMSVEQFDAVLAVNLRGVFLGCQAF